MQRAIVFDSGVGGFSLLSQLPHNLALTYLADQAHFPYGSRSARYLHSRLAQVARWAAKQSPACFVIACNTATVGGVEIFREQLTCPVVAVEPVVKMAKGRTLILATNSALSSVRLQELLAAHPGDILLYAPSGLAEAIEELDIERVKKILLRLKGLTSRENITSIGLSCTHYPLVKEHFARILPGITLLDPSSAVASHIQNLFKQNSIKIQPSKLEINFLTTGGVLKFKAQIKYYLGEDCEPSRVTI